MTIKLCCAIILDRLKTDYSTIIMGEEKIMATITLTTLSGQPLKVDPNTVRQVLGTDRAVVYLASGIDVEVLENRNEALEKITAPKRRR